MVPYEKISAINHRVKAVDTEKWKIYDATMKLLTIHWFCNTWSNAKLSSMVHDNIKEKGKHTAKKWNTHIYLFAIVMIKYCPASGSLFKVHLNSVMSDFCHDQWNVLQGGGCGSGSKLEGFVVRSLDPTKYWIQSYPDASVRGECWVKSVCMKWWTRLVVRKRLECSN